MAYAITGNYLDLDKAFDLEYVYCLMCLTHKDIKYKQELEAQEYYTNKYK